MNTAATTQKAKYSEGQRVEVLAPDFHTPGFPVVWHPAIVTSVEAREDGLWDVQVVADKSTYHPQIVGKRGGNSRLRSAA